jgi:anti-sigma factor RsiW
MDCTQTRSLMHGRLDQELDLASAMAIDQHLQSCAACKKIYDQHSTLRSAVRQHATYHAAPAGLADRVRADLDRTAVSTPAKTERPRWQWLRFGRWFQLGAAMAATAAVTWTAALQLNGPAQDELIAEQVIAGHARSVLTGHLADLATSDQHTVKPWLSGKLDFSPPVMDLTTAGFPLIGGRLDYLDNRPVAALVYRRDRHLINLFVWPDPKSDRTRPTQTLSKQGYHVLHWRDAGMTFWAISDLNPAEIKVFAEAYASAR